MTKRETAALSFQCDLDERTLWELEMKGWFNLGIVHLPDGRDVSVSFWDPVRLAQDLESEVMSGKTCLAEPGMIIVSKVTVNNMNAAVEELFRSGYFDSFK